MLAFPVDPPGTLQCLSSFPHPALRSDAPTEQCMHLLASAASLQNDACVLEVSTPGESAGFFDDAKCLTRLMRVKQKERKIAYAYVKNSAPARAAPPVFPCPATSITHGRGKYQRALRSTTGRRYTYVLNFLCAGDRFFARVRRAFEITARPVCSAPM